MSISPRIPLPPVPPAPPEIPKDRFARFVASIDVNGGHMLVCLFIIGLGAVFASLKIPKGEDLIVAGAATLFQAMRGAGAENHDTNAPQSARVTKPGETVNQQSPPTIEAQTIQNVDVSTPSPATTSQA